MIETKKLKRVLFINPPQAVTEQIYTKRVAKQYASRAYLLPNTSLAYLAAYMEKSGYEVRILDAAALGLTIAEAVEAIREFDPMVLCYSLCTQNFLNSLNWLRELKSATGITTIAGGFQMDIYPREVVAYQEVDFGVIGEGWETLPELIDTLAARGDVDKVRGVCYLREGEYHATPPRPLSGFSLDDVPFMARHLLPNERYTTVMTREWPITIMLSSLGCPYRCAYCDVPVKSFTPRSADGVVAEIEECIRRFGIREILFQDEIFTLERERTLAICEMIRGRGLKISWSIRARPDLVDREILKMMKLAGLSKINFGIESGDPEMLKRLRRNIPLDVIRKAVRWTKEEGITTLGFFMIGFPGETEEGLKKTIRFALELDCDFIQVNKMVPQPPSVFYREVVEKTGIDYWREYARGNSAILSQLPGIGSSFTPAQLDRLQRRFFQSYYYRPAYIFKRLKRVGSVRELVGLARGAFSIR